MKNFLKLIRKNIFITCFLFASAILLIKIYIIPDSFEFIEPISIYTALLSSVIFIYGFMIAPAVSEYKESERLRTELKWTIENILSDVEYFIGLKPQIETKIFYNTFKEILKQIFNRIADGKKEKNINELINTTNDFLLDAESKWIPANHIIKLKQELSTLRKTISRLFFIKDNDSLPKVVHNLKNFITIFIITTLMFLNIWNESIDTVLVEIKEGIVIFILSFIYMYLSFIINSLENPFDKRNFDNYIDISFLKEYQESLQEK